MARLASTIRTDYITKRTKLQHAIRDYYVHLDRQIGTLLERVPEETIVLVVSDHGIKAMHGGLCVNEWLRREGYLVLRDRLRVTGWFLLTR